MALDYGMALARGLVAPQKALQDRVKKLAGDQFKSEDWWNKQLSNQIAEGRKETSRVSPTYFNERSRSGNWASTFNARVAKKGYESATPVYGPQYRTKPQRGGRGRLKQDLIGYDAVKQVNLSSGELKAIENQSKEQTRLTKRAANQAKKRTRKRTAAGSSGLLGRSEIKKKGLAADMPALGSTSLSTSLGTLKTMLG
tara:strand:- start:1588 stop:2181 length:594 start_codon:yes stop_codon:yes gene_type:complete